jgi:uncharacterized protein (DUF885 family)
VTHLLSTHSGSQGEKALGKKFSTKEIHDTVLQIGSVPLAVPEQVIDDSFAAKR